MGSKSKQINFTRPIQTRGGSDVRLYDIFDGRYINGAYYEQSEDIWYPCQWSSTGEYGDKPTALDLINITAYPQEAA